jgi:uncharacterized protein (DUF1501 family)
VAAAFRTGRYDGIGSGRNGCLLATVAAVLLDREAREAAVEADPGAGQLREPLLKVLHALRALQFAPSPGRELEWVDLGNAVGQNPHNAPSVFSFFKPEFSPPGLALAAPEAEILTPPLIVRQLNALMSLGKYSALTDCGGGLVVGRNRTRSCSRMLSGAEDAAGSAAGVLTYRPAAGASPAAVVDELALLLTAGKLAPATRAILEREFVAAGNGSKGLQAVQQLLFTTPEFHAAGLQGASPDAAQSGPRKVPKRLDNSARPYKAIVYIFLGGGADSFNMLVPHSECRGGKDMYADYAAMRTRVALNRSALLPIRPVPGTQVCNVMGLHPNFPKLRDMYNSGDAALLAGVGNLIAPVASKQEFGVKTTKLPFGLFAHNAQQQATMTLRPQSAKASGVLGRVADALTAQGFSVGSYSLDGSAPALAPEASYEPDTISWSSGLQNLDPSPTSARIRPALANISATPAAGVFAEHFAASLASTLDRAAVLGPAVGAAVLKQTFAAASPPGNKMIAKELQLAAKLVAARKSLGTDRDLFFADLGGFDTHNDAFAVHASKFQELDDALESFRQEMVLQGTWDSTLVVLASEWGRCLTSNGVGTDHGWSGNYFVLGGAVKGAQILGTYPDSLQGSPLDLGRGRMLPTTPWDAVWNAAAQWFGVAPDRMDNVLPNRINFAAKGQLFSISDMFKP